MRTMERYRLSLRTLSGTQRLAQVLAKHAKAGDMYALTGGLGAGKTTFARYFIQSYYGDDTLSVTSPTYVIEVPYEPMKKGQERIQHIDLFRLKAADLDVVPIGHEGQDILLVEWPANCPNLRRNNMLVLSLNAKESDEGEESRTVELQGHGDWSTRLLQLAKELPLLTSS